MRKADCIIMNSGNPGTAGRRVASAVPGRIFYIVLASKRWVSCSEGCGDRCRTSASGVYIDGMVETKRREPSEADGRMGVLCHAIAIIN
jgi:hypothetical protein